MRSVKQRVLALLLTAAMTCTFVVPAFAAETANPADPAQTNTEETTQAAEGLIEEADLSALQAEQPAAAPAAVEGHAELPKEPMKASVKVSSQEAAGSNTYGDGPAEWAFDNQLNQAWHSSYGKELPQWISWNLGTNGETFEISQIHYEMKNHATGGNGLWKKVTVEAILAGQQAASESFTLTSGDTLLTLSKPVVADSIKITITESAGNTDSEANKFACAGELSVIGKKVEGGQPQPEPEQPETFDPAAEPEALPEGKEYKQLAQGSMKNISATSEHANNAAEHRGDGPAAWAFDGLNASGWHIDYSASVPQSIQWELGGVKTIGQIGYIRMDNKDAKGNGRWKDVKIEGQKADDSWTVLRTFTLSESAMQNNGDEVKIRFVPTEVKALKVTVTDSYNTNGKFAQAGEIKTYEVADKIPVTPDPDVPAFEIAGYAALDKTPMQLTAHASSEEAAAGSQWGDGPAAWAFDGDPTKAWHSHYRNGKVEGPHTIEWSLSNDGNTSFLVSRLEYVMKNNATSGNGLWENVKVEVKTKTGTKVVHDGPVSLNSEKKIIFDFPMTMATGFKVTVNAGAGGFACAGELTVYKPLTALEVEPDALPNDMEYQKIPFASITGETASSAHVTTAQTGDGPADWAFDGKTNTAWHVEYNQTKVPHWIEWHLDGVKTIGQIGYIRNDNGGKNTGNGRWKDVTVSGQLEDGTWKDLRVYTIQEAAMNNDGSEVLIRFVPTAVKALKVTINDSYNSGADKYAQAGEINTYEVAKKAHYTMNLTSDTKQVNEGESFTLTAQLMADLTNTAVENVTYVWTVQGGILTVAPNGNTAVVTAKAPGKATVRVEAVYGGGTHYAVCQVNVAPQAKTSVIAINGTDHTVKSLKEAVTAAGTQNIESIVFKTGVITPADFEYMQANKTLLDYELKTFRIEDAVVPVGLKDDAIPVNAFKLDNGRGNGLVEVYLGKNIKGIEASAFYKCPDLVSFAAPGVIFLKENALGGTTKLVKLELPALTELKDNSIKDVTVQQLVLPKVTTIGTNALRTFTKLAEVTLGDTVPAIQFRAPLNLASKPAANGVKLYVSEKAMAAYQVSAYFADGKWAGLTLTAAPVKPEEITWQSNLVVADGVSVNFYGKIPAELVKDTVVEITVDEKTVTLPVEEAKQTATGEYIFPVATTVRQMTDNIHIVVKQNGQQVGEVLNYTVRDNAEALLSSDTVSAEAKNLARAMLYHGAQMQQYKNHLTEDLATKNLSADEQKALEDAAAAIQTEDLEAYRATRRGKVSDLELFGMNLSLMDETTLRYFFVKGEGYQPANFTITDNLGNTYKAEDKGDMISVEIPGIAAAQLDVMIDLTVAAGGETLTVHYGPLSYARSVLDSKDVNLQNVARSMVLYNQAADDYAASLVK